MKKHERIVFMKGDLVELNLDYLKLKTKVEEDLYLILDCQPDVYDQDSYVRLHVRNIRTGHELKPIVLVTEGVQRCEWLHVV